MEADLARIAERLGIEVRHVRYEGEGGFYSVGGKQMLAVNDSLDTPDRVAVMAKALAKVRGTEDMYVAPAVRRLLDRYVSEESEGQY